MLTKITDDLWLDFDKLVRVSIEGSEIKYTIDFKEKMVTYYAPPEVKRAFLDALDAYHAAIQPVQSVDELIEDLINNPDGEEV